MRHICYKKETRAQQNAGLHKVKNGREKYGIDIREFSTHSTGFSTEKPEKPPANPRVAGGAAVKT